MMSYRTYKIRNWPNYTVLEWFNLLSRMGVHLGIDRKRLIKDCTIDLLYRTEHIKCGETPPKIDKDEDTDAVCTLTEVVIARRRRRKVDSMEGNNTNIQINQAGR